MPCSNTHLLKFGTDLEVNSGTKPDGEPLKLSVLTTFTSPVNIPEYTVNANAKITSTGITKYYKNYKTYDQNLLILKFYSNPFLLVAVAYTEWFCSAITYSFFDNNYHYCYSSQSLFVN